jgi:hypothetical protein
VCVGFAARKSLLEKKIQHEIYSLGVGEMIKMMA